MGTKIERRKSFRLPFNTDVVCRVNEINIQGTICDLSVTGLFMKTTERPSTASKCDLEIVVHGDHSSLRIEKIKGVVIRRGEDGIGIQFDERLEWIALVPIYFHKIQEELN